MLFYTGFICWSDGGDILQISSGDLIVLLGRIDINPNNLQAFFHTDLVPNWKDTSLKFRYGFMSYSSVTTEII